MTQSNTLHTVHDDAVLRVCGHEFGQLRALLPKMTDRQVTKLSGLLCDEIERRRGCYPTESLPEYLKVQIAGHQERLK